MWGWILLAALGAIYLWIKLAQKRADNIEAQRRAYEQLAYDKGQTFARSQCAHKYVRLTQTGAPGVITLTRKWCRVCGIDMGPAKLKGGMFGNYWE